MRIHRACIIFPVTLQGQPSVLSWFPPLSAGWLFVRVAGRANAHQSDLPAREGVLP